MPTIDPPARRHAAPPHAPPQQILLATDLSCRCDRALDRSVRLARLWHAQLRILHVIEDPADPDQPADAQASRVEREIRADMGRRHVAFDVVLERGDAAGAILHQAAVCKSGLIVTGIARNETFGRNVLGKTVEAVLRRAPVPVLVTKTRPHGPYRRIVVPTDFSASARHALECAMRFFPDARFTLMHAFHVPFEAFSDHAADTAAYRNQARAAAERFLSTVQRATTAPTQLKTVIEHGSPGEVLADLLRRSPAELVVLGTHEQSGLLALLLGSTAEHLLSLLSCDILVVREPRHG